MTDPTTEPSTSFNPESPELYLNRELTWLRFNERILEEAADTRVPLLERVKYLAIFSSNLDEFFMKRVGGLKRQEAAEVQELTPDGLMPTEQILEIYERVNPLFNKAEIILDQELLPALEKHDVCLMAYDALTVEQKQYLRSYFETEVFPILTPLAMDPGHPFPFISNLAISLLVQLRIPGKQRSHLARVKVPTSITPRWVRLEERRHHYVPLEEVIGYNLDLLFPNTEVLSWEVFRVIRNANTERNEEEADDLLDLIEEELRDRRFAPVVRLEITDEMNSDHLGMLSFELRLNEALDTFRSSTLLGLRDLMDLSEIQIPELHDPPHHPVVQRRLHGNPNVFHIIRDKPLLLHHPYEAFTASVERFLRESATDPKVLAIKMTIYRTSRKSPIIRSLLRAARNGKQVVVLVELKARFDEAANVAWARTLEEAGIHVTYGLVGLKTHTKVTLVVRRDFDGIRRYCHIGTGNYHPVTARIYTDLGLLTADSEIGADLTDLFNVLTGHSRKRRYRKLLVAPHSLRDQLIAWIDREIEQASKKRPGRIRIKCNALEDKKICQALYRASQAGVVIQLIVRDTCRLRPGVPGLSETIQVISIVGRFLEHSRIYHFHNGGDDLYCLGSADLMKRNLSSRVEVVVPVEHPDHRKELAFILDTLWNDQRQAWEMQPDGRYLRRCPDQSDGQTEQVTQPTGCHAFLAQRALEQHIKPSYGSKKRRRDHVEKKLLGV